MLNAVRFDAKCGAFWGKMQGKMVLIATQNTAKCGMKSIKIHCNGINNPLSNCEKHGSKGQNIHQKVGF